MQCALASKNKLGFVNGTIPEPASEPARSASKQADEMVCAWVLNSISKEIAKTYVYSSSARRLWLDLEEQFDESNGPHIYKIQRQIDSMEQGGVSVVLYYGRLKKLWEELNVAAYPTVFLWSLQQLHLQSLR